MESQQIPLLAPLAVGIGAIAITVVIHGLALLTVVNFIRQQERLGYAGKQFWLDVPIVAMTIFIALAAHLLEIAVWAILLMICRQYSAFGSAYYHAGLSYTTLGDVAFSPTWSLLSTLAATDGMLMFGVSTAMIFAIIQRLLATRYADLKR
jgi:hypothetical protein